MRALVVVPEFDELEPILERWSALGHRPCPVHVGKLSCFAVPSLGLTAALGGHGKAQLALQTQYLVDHCGGVDALLCVGAAGRLSEVLHLGDIIAGTATIEHDYKLRFVRAEPPSHRGTAALLNQLGQLAAARRFAFGIHLGKIASGDEDIVDAARAAELAAASGALCVAWEGSGAARAAAFNGLDFLELRCITDGADADAALSFREHCSRVMPNLAELIAAWLVPGT
jgi:adenosylhomocysteine nucleosidase